MHLITHQLPKLTAIADFLWRISCAYWFLRRLGLSWARHVWGLSGASLESAQHWRDSFGDQLPSPMDAVDDELSHWGD